jgi:hypothetical protein
MFHFVRLFVLSMAIACAVTTDITFSGPLPVPPPTVQPVANRKPDGLILSTGNLYFTSHDAAGAAVWRMGQTGNPDQETILYWEAGAVFGDIVFAQVNGEFFGYFFAQRGIVVTIRRVPLAGGNAVTLGTVGSDIDIANSHHNLVTDGVNLYWQDVNTIRKMPIGGGGSTVLDNTASDTPTAGIDLQGTNIIYASVADIRFVPTSGANTTPQVRTIATAASRVTALHAVSNGVYWGEQNGPVRLKVGTTTTTLPAASGLATSISNNQSTSGGDQAWTQCVSQSCQLVLDFAGSNSSQPIGADAFGVAVTPSGSVFWADAAGVHRRLP